MVVLRERVSPIDQSNKRDRCRPIPQKSIAYSWLASWLSGSVPIFGERRFQGIDVRGQGVDFRLQRPRAVLPFPFLTPLKTRALCTQLLRVPFARFDERRPLALIHNRSLPMPMPTPGSA